MPTKAKKIRANKSLEQLEQLEKRVGGAMAVRSQNVMSKQSFPAPFDQSSGGAKPKEKKSDQKDQSKPKRKLSAYNLFVKAEMSKLKDVPHKDRMKKIGEMWKESKK